MRKIIDLNGQRFGRLVVDKYCSKYYASCKCDCGNEKIIYIYSLKNGETKSCGCLNIELAKQRNFIDLIGKKFGRLTAIRRVKNSKSENSRWLCRCDCGKEKVILGRSLTSGRTKSCGCFRNEQIRKWTKNNMSLIELRGCWTKEENNILKQCYYDFGLNFCVNKLIKKTRQQIKDRVWRLRLKTKIKGDNEIKYVVEKISDSNCNVLSICKIHGKTRHHYYNNKVKYCLECRRIQRLNPLFSFAHNLRCNIRHCFKKIHNKNGEPIKRRCFKNLDYTPVELYNYLSNIQKLQNNKCPICKTDYKNCIVSIDHVIPVSRAKTIQQIIDLFDLKNLNLMCKNCNSSKNDANYNIWKDNKRCH
jgi:hypothetical protein